MRFSPVLLIAASAVAFTVPKGQPNGVYQVFTEANGTETHTFLHPLPNSNEKRSDTLGNPHVRRQLPPVSVGCGGYQMNPTDTNNANNALDAQCGAGANVGKGLDFYSISGCVVSYFCNLGGSGTDCFASERQQAATQYINPVCGGFWAGWVNFNIPSRDGQYGWEDICGAGSHFCGRGTSG
ncbi:hypothetical protein DL95DRAFT_415032 [Leptodontidium sp. 2 PMI_412]|nr:hypothetical protein DL95DRAFT_415032 [Leptodontidium sp. 2 PMI_412]